ncbi:site-specific recombinase, phage integrase family protein [Erythrobacter sp. NAP1]|uniref:tyrosine-type recombinase/integrase n=1 Tax=Erythrobacter sp. NAP1 TaxID=237727 RepID=UPI0000686C74|nr:site-specific integrase [Erythrobacter sp. NAP1]EAQ29729.1 site-specific recombinase, phage integrase family protein [Erythrobacter sp. NAP1]
MIEYWDSELPGFGLRVHPSGCRTWFVMFRQRGKQRRVSLGTTRQNTATEARRIAREKLAEVALDGLPSRKTTKSRAKEAPLMREYAERFWADYAHHWKPSTRQRNRTGIDRDILPTFGDRRVDEITKADISFWRDGFAERTGAFNRTIPILSVMMGYAEQIGYRSRGSNPCRGTPRYKRKRMERFLSAREYGQLATALDYFEAEHSAVVAAIRLLIYTGARCGEIENLSWEWVQEPRIMLPDSKTGAKIVYLNRQAAEVITSIPDRKPTGLVFPSVRDPERPMKLGMHWPEIRNRAALPDVRLHDLRHSFASTAIRDNISLMVIGKLLGHALAETTSRYAHLSDEVIADAAERVSGSIASLIGVSQ